MFKIKTVSAMKVTVDIRQAIKKGLIDPNDINDLAYFLKSWPTIDIFGYCKSAENGKKVLELWYQPVNYGRIEFAIGFEAVSDRVDQEFLNWIEPVLANYIQWNDIY